MSEAVQAAVEFRGVTKDYVTDWRGRRRRAVEGVDLVVRAGTVCALVGPNGSGKTTLLKIAAGLTAPSAGACMVRGRIGFAPDDLVLPVHLSAREALNRLALIVGCPVGSVDDAVAAAGLGAEADRPMREFSKGWRQRAALAQAWLARPDVLLLDEPAAALDPRAARALAERLRAARAEGRTVVVSSHFLPQIEEVADQFLVLEGGRAVWSGTAEELRARGGLEAVYLEATRR